MKRTATSAALGPGNGAAALVLIAALTLAVLLAAALTLAACASEKQGAFATAPASIEPNGPISWGEAQSRIGERLTAEGPVTSVQEAGGEVAAESRRRRSRPEPARRGHSRLVRDKFPGDAATAYQDELVRVTGVIEDRDGVATIVVAKPADVKTGL